MSAVVSVFYSVKDDGYWIRDRVPELGVICNATTLILCMAKLVRLQSNWYMLRHY
jgi:hypothetical protein